jgi:predicted flap endonuclease-1-like 5' DNA nuclease
LLIAGGICGILWEFWNFWATTKWIYTVPFLEELKLFEMPLVGFLGFPPFTVECYVMYNFISLFRHQRGWEEDNYRLNPEKKVNPFLLLGGALFGICFCLCTFKAMDEKTINSYWPDLKELQTIRPETVMSLTSLGIRTPKALLAKTKSEQGRKYLTLKLNVTENEIAKWISLAKLTELKGMGTLNANLLNKAGIGNIQDLAKQDPAMLYEKLLALEKNEPQKETPIPRQAIIRVWVREARRIVRDHKQLH